MSMNERESKIVPISEIQQSSGIPNWGCCPCSESGIMSVDATNALIIEQADGTPLVQGLCAEHAMAGQQDEQTADSEVAR